MIVPLDRRAKFGRHRILPDHGLHRISRGELQHDEDQQNHGDHQRDRLEHPDERVSHHVAVQFNRKKFAHSCKAIFP